MIATSDIQGREPKQRCKYENSNCIKHERTPVLKKREARAY